MGAEHRASGGDDDHLLAEDGVEGEVPLDDHLARVSRKAGDDDGYAHQLETVQPSGGERYGRGR